MCRKMLVTTSVEEDSKYSAYTVTNFTQLCYLNIHLKILMSIKYRYECRLKTVSVWGK